MARLVVKNGHDKDSCYDDIELCAQDILTILGSILNITIGRAFVITWRERKLHFDILKVFHLDFDFNFEMTIYINRNC